MSTAIQPALLQPSKTATETDWKGVGLQVLWMGPLGIVLGLVCGMLVTGHIAFPSTAQAKTIQAAEPVAVAPTVTKEVPVPVPAPTETVVKRVPVLVTPKLEPSPTPSPEIDRGIDKWNSTSTKPEQSEPQSTLTKEKEPPTQSTTPSSDSSEKQESWQMPGKKQSETKNQR